MATSHLVVDAMNAWSAAAVAHLESSSPSLLEALRERLQALGSFSQQTFPQVVHSLPVLYMFSGSDLLTAHALFPHAPSYHLVADFPTGDPSCFLDAACASKANESASAFFKHWANLRFARQSTNLMRRAFATSGQLPALLLSLRLMGQPVVHAHATADAATDPTYHAANLASSGAVGSSALLGRAPPPLVATSALGRRLRGVGGGGGGGVAFLHNGTALLGRAGGHRGGALGGAHSGIKALASRDAQLRLPSVTLHTPSCRVSYTSMLLRSDPSEHVQLNKQFWPVMARWARGGPYIDAQMRALSTAIGATGSRRLFVSMFKAA